MRAGRDNDGPGPQTNVVAAAEVVPDLAPGDMRLIARDCEQIALQRQRAAQRARRRFRDRVRSSLQEPDIAEDVKRTVRERDGFHCVYCGATTSRLQIDHVWPRSFGGPGVIANLQTLCPPCNRWKWDDPVVLVFRGERMYARRVYPRTRSFVLARWPRVAEAA